MDYYQLLKQLKKQFFDFCCSLSVEELSSNDRLFRIVERIDRMLVEFGAVEGSEYHDCHS